MYNYLFTFIIWWYNIRRGEKKEKNIFVIVVDIVNNTDADLLHWHSPDNGGGGRWNICQLVDYYYLAWLFLVLK